MKIIGSSVRHKQFGNGLVQAREGRVLYVLFDGEAEFRSFLYPDAFREYLSVEDPALYEQINDDMTAVRVQQQQELEQRRVEKEKRLSEKRSRALELAQLHRTRTSRTAKARAVAK